MQTINLPKNCDAGRIEGGQIPIQIKVREVRGICQRNEVLWQENTDSLLWTVIQNFHPNPSGSPDAGKWNAVGQEDRDPLKSVY